MATHIFILACIGMFLSLLNSSCVTSLEESICTFPPGSIACKVWNHTNMDCAWRELVCVPPLHHKTSLESLDLSHNKLETIPENVFMGFNKLQTLDLSSNMISLLNDNSFYGLDQLSTLDLSSNSISSLPENVFRGLHNLLMLNLSSCGIESIGNNTFSELSTLKILDLFWPDAPLYHGLAITTSTFTGLKNLLSLSVTVRNTTGTPFIHVPALKHMKLKMNNGYFVDHQEIFTGLIMLEYIEVIADFSDVTIDICPLISLQSLNTTYAFFTIKNKECVQFIPLRILDAFFDDVPPFEMLNNLTSLTLVGGSMDQLITELNSLDSPLHHLSLQTALNDMVIMNSTTFQCWPKWKESLKVLKIAHCLLLLEGSPFKWFPKLQVLHIIDISQGITVSNITFDGLNSLQELHLPNLYLSDYDMSIALPIFGKYNSLKRLNLAHNQLAWCLDFICSVLSLEKVDLSYNHFQSNSFQFRCTSPNLEILETESPTFLGTYRPIMYLDTICIKAPNLTMLNAKSSKCKILNQFTCPKLVAAYLSKSQIIFSNTSIIIVPHLEELYLNEITFNAGPLTNIKILKNFKMSKLKIVDLSCNQISVIDREDVLVLSNVVYLNLRNNTLTSLSSLKHLSKIQVLLLGGNEISIGPSPKLLLRNKLNTLDMCNNVLQCDCSVEAFRTWILSNKVGFLTSNCSTFDPDGMQYKCSMPYSRKGLSVTEITLDCESPVVTIISVSIACVVFVTVITALIVRYYWHIRYGVFLLFNRRVHQNYLVNDDDADNNDDEENGMPMYDAYVTYHRQDEDWVDEELLPNIEEGEERFRLCLRTRDMRAGRPVFGEMSLRIQRSRKILVILSPRFVNDNWCYFELNMAHHRVLEENSKVLIFIMLERIPDDKLTLLLRQLFCRAQCFKFPADGYGQRLFWQRIREELKRPVPRDRRFNV